MRERERWWWKKEVGSSRYLSGVHWLLVMALGGRMDNFCV
jgi:hypothetical protein